MVKKSSFFEKLKSRLRSTDVRVEPTGAGVGGVGLNRVERRGPAAAAPSSGPPPAARTSAQAPRAATVEDPLRTGIPANGATAEARVTTLPGERREAVSSRKVSPQEEATIAIRDGFSELSSLLRGMQVRVEDQGEKFATTVDAISRLPALGEAQLEMLRSMAERMEQQTTTNLQVANALSGLPEALADVRSALDRAAATDERTASTLGEFRGNMERIQDAMGQMVDHSRTQAKSAERLAEQSDGKVTELAASFGKAQERTASSMADRLEATQRDSVRSLREAHADQATRLGRMIDDGTKTNRAILIMLGLVFVSILVVAGVLASQ